MEAEEAINEVTAEWRKTDRLMQRTEDLANIGKAARQDTSEMKATAKLAEAGLARVKSKFEVKDAEFVGTLKWARAEAAKELKLDVSLYFGGSSTPEPLQYVVFWFCFKIMLMANIFVLLSML